jgi:hypothetical protein
MISREMKAFKGIGWIKGKKLGELGEISSIFGLDIGKVESSESC